CIRLVITFLSPTPPGGTVLPCANATEGCHFLVYYNPDNSTKDCQQVKTASSNVHIFHGHNLLNDVCVQEVLVLPQSPASQVCLQAGSGETRCFDVPLVNVSGPDLCSNNSCNHPDGACLPDPAVGTTKCVCHAYFDLPNCLPDVCKPNPCQNGGFCQALNGTHLCFCPLGFSGFNCSTPDANPLLSKPQVTDQLGPTPGGTVTCKVNTPCQFPVYTSGDNNGAIPVVGPGPMSPDLNVTVETTVADNSTGLPGSTFLTPVVATSAVPGQKQLCVNVGNQNGVTDSACFHVIFTFDNPGPSSFPALSSTLSPDQTDDNASFASPTPPTGTTLPCANSIDGCHFLVFSKPGNSSLGCPHVTALTPKVIIFPTKSNQGGDLCINEILVLPQASPQTICLQAGSGESRCFNVPQVNISGPALCENRSCNSPHGACLADPSIGTTQCVCANYFSLPTCLPEPCNPNPCQHGGVCQQNNGSYTCFCRLGFSGTNCSMVAVDQHPTSPSVTDQLGPTPGGTINCRVNTPCHFPVYTRGNSNGTFPTVSPGPMSPEMSVKLNATVADNSTGLPGLTYLTPITTISTIPGHRQLCVNIGNQQAVTDSACFQVIFTGNDTSISPTPNSSGWTNDSAKFIPSTPPDGTTLPCADAVNGCHFLVYSESGNTTADCPQVSATSPGV
ncbi:hypothetical protein EGW08_015100, partial [Elysia chlorotica]